MGFLEAIPRRLFNLAGFIFCAGLLSFAYYQQFYQGLEPCPLCILQRVGFMVLALLFLLAAIHNPGRIGSRVYGLLILVAGLTGMGISIRHVYLQHLPANQLPDCGPGLDYMLEVFPLTETLKMMFTGSGECGEIVWSFLGLSMPAWALLFFFGMAIFGFLRNGFGKN